MSGFEIIKYLHISCVFFSLLGFILRSYFLLASPAMLLRPWLKYPPHAVETLLLLSALAMLPLLGKYPFVDSWLTAKLLAMLLYIVIAGYTLHRAKSLTEKLAFISVSLLLWGYIVGVAISHNPYSFLAL